LQLKQRLQLFTLGIGGIGLVSAYFSYSPEIAASFGAGLIGSVLYLRMLGTSVDSLAGGTGETVKYVSLCCFSIGICGLVDKHLSGI
jgi:ATP synthase protein I